MRDTAAWALGRALETLHLPHSSPALLADDAALHRVLGALLPALQDHSCVVADKAAWGLKCVAAGYEGVGEAAADAGGALHARSPGFRV